MTILDLSGMRAYLDGDIEEEREIVDIFINKAHSDLKKIYMSMECGDLETWREVSHSLKGSAAMLGAGMLSDICFKAEQMNCVDNQDMKQLYNEISNAYELTLKALLEENLIDASILGKINS